MNNTVTRRMLLYWLLLLVPTLAVGAGAIWLLHREQGRIDEQTRVAASLRREAVVSRTKLIAENIETLVVDVQNGLMDTLNKAPTDDPVPFLADWRKANNFVLDVFQLDSNGVAQQGSSNPAVTEWLKIKPWQKVENETLLAQTVVVRVEPRKDLLPGNVTAQTQPQVSEKALQERLSANAAQYSMNRSQIRAASSVENIEAAIANLNAAIVSPLKVKSLFWNQTGWSAWTDAQQRLHLFGWRLCANDTVLLVEVNLEELARNLGDALPVQIDEDERYVLRRSDDTVVRETRWAEGDYTLSKLSRARDYSNGDNTAPTSVVPLSARLLPGWTVSGYWRENAVQRFSNNTFFLTSSVLVGIFVLTILSGGGLLLRQAKLSEAESVQKTSFVANVSHEFKTPLTTIRLYAELLEQGRVRDDTARAECLQTISRETQRLARLVNNVLDFSRLEQGRKEFSRVPTDLTTELGRLLDRFAPRLADAGMRLERHLPTTPLLIKTDLDAVEQIVLNLLENACKYAAEGGEVAVSLTEAASGVEMQVADRGPGIPVRQHERVFEKFHRVDNTLTAAKNGVGLGLSIARQLARGLGGELCCLARPGGGCVFVLTLGRDERSLG